MSNRKSTFLARPTISQRKHRDEMFQQGMLWCTGCEQYHPIKDFRKYIRAKRSNYGYRYYCCRCVKTQQDAQKERASQRMKERNADLKRYWVDLAGCKCQRCGFYEFISALEFHHVYPALKKNNPSALIFNNNKNKTWKELDKCCLLCSICHRAYKAGEWKAEFIKRDGLGWTVGDSLPLDDGRYEIKKLSKPQQTPLPLFTYQQSPEQMTLLESRAGYAV